MKENIQKAVALKYDASQHEAPSVIAKGKGEIAEKIIQKALENEVSIKEDRALVQLLYEIEINNQIPEQLYPVVAEIFALIYQAEQKAGAINYDKKA